MNNVKILMCCNVGSLETLLSNFLHGRKRHVIILGNEKLCKIKTKILEGSEGIVKPVRLS